MDFEILEDEVFSSGTVIKVIGVGGAGGNAVSHMFSSGLNGVEFICANTDRQALVRAQAHARLGLGQNGLGAGAKPEQGRLAAEAARGEIRAALTGAHMVFITAGMGGGTGTGAAPVVAEIAKELGILTVGVVTKPFAFEGNRRAIMAEQGIAELSRHVHSLIVVLNENLYQLLDEEATQEDCFKAADDVLYNACAGIAEIINVEGNVNVDFEDVKSIMVEQGQAMMGTATATGANRAQEAADKAIACPLLEGVDLHGARGILVNITANRSLKMRETRVVMDTIRSYAAEDANIIFGTAYDDDMGEELRVTVVATGLGQAKQDPDVRLVHSAVDMGDSIGTGHYHASFGSPMYETARAEPRLAQGAPIVPQGVPSVMRNPRAGNMGNTRTAATANKGGNPGLASTITTQVQSMMKAGMDKFDVPAYLRKQVR